MTSWLNINQLLRLLLLISLTTPGYAQNELPKICGNECQDIATGKVSCAQFKQKGLCKISAIASTTCPCTCDLCPPSATESQHLIPSIQEEQLQESQPEELSMPKKQQQQVGENQSFETPNVETVQKARITFNQSSTTAPASKDLPLNNQQKNVVVETLLPIDEVKDQYSGLVTRIQNMLNSNGTSTLQVKEVILNQDIQATQKIMSGGNSTKLDSKEKVGDVQAPTPVTKQFNHTSNSQKNSDKSLQEEVEEAATIKQEVKFSEENDNIQNLDQKNSQIAQNGNQTNVAQTTAPIPAKVENTQNVPVKDVTKTSPVPAKIQDVQNVQNAQNVPSQDAQKIAPKPSIIQNAQNVPVKDANITSPILPKVENVQNVQNAQNASPKGTQAAPIPAKIDIKEQQQVQNVTKNGGSINNNNNQKYMDSKQKGDQKQIENSKQTASQQNSKQNTTASETPKTVATPGPQSEQKTPVQIQQNPSQNGTSSLDQKNKAAEKEEEEKAQLKSSNNNQIQDAPKVENNVEQNNKIKNASFENIDEIASVPESFDDEPKLGAPTQEKSTSQISHKQEKVVMFAPKQEQKQSEKLDYQSQQQVKNSNETKFEFPKVEEFKKSKASNKAKKQPVYVGCGKSRPNFLVIMTDDQGHDDIGFYNWNHVLKTPNMDKLAQNSVQFENFYTDPLCAPTRASLLTGRHHMKTGVWGVHGGMDYINLDETLIAEALQYHGYKTAHFGKWHSGNTPGYNPWDRGFELSYTTKLYTFYNTVVKKNGWTMQTSGWVEDWLADRIVEYLQQRMDDGQPFFVLWTPMSIHKGRKHDSEWYEDFVAPEQYYNNYWGKVSRDLVHVFAMLEYFDSVLGKVMWKLDEFGLTDDTVVMFFGDNGPHIYQTDHEWGDNRYQRVPSQMAEQKGFIEENGIRNFLFVQGQNMFPAGRQVYENVGAIDIYPTLLDLAGVGPPEWNKQLDGVSFAPLLCKDGWWSHTDRYLFFHEVLKNSLGTNEIFGLDENRETDRYQKMLKYWEGGQWGQGFQYSTGVRHKQWKYIKTELFDIPAQNYQEYDWNRFSKTDWGKSNSLKDFYKGKIDEWWWSVLADPGSFKKPTFLIGKEEYNPVRLVGAIERTPWHISVADQSVSGFKYDGDYLICRVRVLKEGNYDVRLNFGWTGYKGAYIEIAVGQNWQLWNGEAPSVQRKIDNNGPLGFGNMYLPQTGDKDDEMMIRLNGRDWNDGSEVFWWIDSVEFITKS